MEKEILFDFMDKWKKFKQIIFHHIVFSCRFLNYETFRAQASLLVCSDEQIKICCFVLIP